MSDSTDLLIVELEAKIDKLEKSLSKAQSSFSAANDNMVQKAHRTAEKVNEEFGKINVGKAFDRVLDESRLGVLEAGTERLRLFGSALEPLGPLGLTAAATIAAMGIAFDRAIKGAEWAEDVQTAAHALGVTTKAVQEFDFVATATGVPVDRMRESLKGLNEVLGQVQAGLARGQTKSLFDGLLGKDAAGQLRKLGDLENILPVLLDRIARLPATEQAGIAERLRVDPEVLQSLIEARGNLSGLIEEAHRYGIIVDASLIQKSAEAAEKMHIASDVIDKEMKVAFMDLAPMVEKAAVALAHFAQAAANLINGVTGNVSTMDQFQGSLAKYRDLLTAVGQVKAHIAQNHGLVTPTERDLLAGYAKALKEVQGEFTAESARFKVDNAPPEAAPAQPIAGGKPKATPGESFADAQAQALRSVDDGAKSLQEAQAQLTTNILQRAQFERAAIDADAKSKADELAAQAEKVQNDRKLTAAQRDQVLGELQVAQLENEIVASAKRDKVLRDTMTALLQQRVEYEKQLSDYTLATLKDAADLASTAAQRRAIEAAILQHQQLDEQAQLRKSQDQAIQNGDLSPYDAAAQFRALLARQQAEWQAMLKASQSPGQSFAAQLSTETGSGLGESFEKIDVSGITNLGDALDAVIMKTKTAKEAFHDWALSVAKDMLSLATKKFIEAPLANMMFPGSAGDTGKQAGAIAASAGLNNVAVSANAAAMALSQLGGVGGLGGAAGAAGAGGGSATSSLPFIGQVLSMIPHFADGTDNAGGGLALVGEDGPELEEVPAGAKITPNNVLRGMGGLGPSAMRVASSTYAPTFDLRGAVMTDDLLRQMNEISVRHTQGGVAQAVAISRSAVQDDMRRGSRQRLGPS